MMKHFKGLKVCALATILLAGVGLVGCKHGSPDQRVDHISGRIASKLSFTDQQNLLLNDITAELKVDMNDEKSRHLAMKEEVKKIILAADLDQARIKELILERHARMNAKIDKYLTKVAALHKALTVEQKNEILGMIEKFSQHFEE